MDRRFSFSGGAIVALAIFTGAAIGATRGAVSFGVLLGAGLGGLIALAIWLSSLLRI